jgi:putative phage-type endonuclease
MIVQGSPEWHQARLGKVTASRVCDVVAKTKNGWGASRANYLAELVAERLTGTAAESYTNAAMQWGTATEPEARAAYEFRQLVDVEQVGFVDHPEIRMSGASPDGLIGKEGLVEIKCPNTATHIETLIGGQGQFNKYYAQMQWQMACTERLWCDFVSYDPRLPGNMRLFVQRVERAPEEIAHLEANVKAFLRELDEKVATLTRLYGKPQLIAAE